MVACKSLPQKTVEAKRTQLTIPYLEKAPKIDGDLSDWRDHAFTDGVWDIDRLKHTDWYESGRNRLADHGESPDITQDLSARYYMAWDEKYLYLGAYVHDNALDLVDPYPAPKRWYYKDAITWFIEAPQDAIADTFDAGCHGLSFVADTTYPESGAWWRHGTDTESFVEEPLPKSAVDYRFKFISQTPGQLVYSLEARVEMEPVFGAGDKNWRTPKEGDIYGMMIVHCDPDGGNYGGHFLIYGKGDPDQSWSSMKLSGPKPAMVRRPK